MFFLFHFGILFLFLIFAYIHTGNLPLSIPKLHLISIIIINRGTPEIRADTETFVEVFRVAHLVRGDDAGFLIEYEVYFRGSHLHVVSFFRYSQFRTTGLISHLVGFDRQTELAQCDIMAGRNKTFFLYGRNGEVN